MTAQKNTANRMQQRSQANDQGKADRVSRRALARHAGAPSYVLHYRVYLPGVANSKSYVTLAPELTETTTSGTCTAYYGCMVRYAKYWWFRRCHSIVDTSYQN